ncbi:amidohydrolase family protein [Kribbella sp. GL6]|uniref:amidohydrolase family protein n=1 Tax=Kribbella sp. GL6 TaxID=3419765 RepID=UPI003D04F3EC
MDQGPPPLIDADATIGRNPRADVGTGTAAALLARMDRVGIRTAIVSHTAARWHDPQTGNHRLLDELRDLAQPAGQGEPHAQGEPAGWGERGGRGDQARLLPCWVGLPAGTGEVPEAGEFVAGARAAGVVAVRVYPEDHGFDLAGPDCAPLAAAVAGAGLPLLVDLFQTSWAQLEALAADHPELAIVVGGIGYRVLRRAAGVLDRRPNISIGTANFSNHLGLEWLAERYGPERLVFGTGMPDRDPAEAVTRLLWSELPDDAVAAIGAGNLEHLGVLV